MKGYNEGIEFVKHINYCLLFNTIINIITL